ncbi:MAG: LamG domain-containing protein [Minisyncoccia bacterium]
MDPSYPEVNAQGNSLSVSPLFNPSGLVGWWPLTEGSGSSSIDQSGNGNNGNWTGTASGTNGTYYAGGRVGSWAGYFNGSTDAVNTVSNPSPTGSSRTVCAWIKTTTTSRGGIIDTRGSGSGGFFFSVNRTTAGNLTYAHNGGSAVEIAAGVNNGQWNFVCAVYNVSLAAASLYENGTILGTISSFTAELTTTSTVQIGEDSTGGDLFSGLIDDVRIYNRALSAAEIMAIYNAEK